MAKPHRQSRKWKLIRQIRDAAVPVFLFARLRAKSGKDTLPFVYCGELMCLSMEGDEPVTVLFESLQYEPEAASPLLAQIYSWKSDAPTQVVDQERRDEMEARIASGQGRISDRDLQKKIELRGMELAKHHYKSNGFSVVDTSRNHPYDLECTRGNEVRRVEVKATLSGGRTVYVTSGEVRGANDPNIPTDLFVLYGIRVVKDGASKSVTGGQPHLIPDWQPDIADLTPTQYRYRVPK